MTNLSLILCAFLLALTYAHEGCKECGNEHKVCAAEKLDPSNLVTFKNRAALELYNRYHSDDVYEFLSHGKCKKQSNCPKVIQKICAISKNGFCGKPETFENLCALEKHNNNKPDEEYEYYHDEDCNDVTPVETKNCDCLECGDKKFDPVCAVPADCCGRPETVSNYCSLQKYNCDHADNQYLYFHEGSCYSDDLDDKQEN